jgi:hypothetical protein
LNVAERAGIEGWVMLRSPTMLQRTPLTLNNAPILLSRGLRVLAVAAAAALALASTGCSTLIDGTHDITMDFPVEPMNGAFFGWSEVTLQENIDTVSSALLYGVTLQVEKPAGIPDLTFLQSLSGTAVTPTARTLVVQQTSFPKGESTVELKLVYYGDLHPLFKDQYTIRIDWTGETNPSYTDWPTDGTGIWVLGDVTVDLQE